MRHLISRQLSVVRRFLRFCLPTKREPILPSINPAVRTYQTEKPLPSTRFQKAACRLNAV